MSIDFEIPAEAKAIREKVRAETSGEQVPDVVRSDLPEGGLVLMPAPRRLSSSTTAKRFSKTFSVTIEVPWASDRATMNWA